MLPFVSMGEFFNQKVFGLRLGIVVLALLFLGAGEYTLNSLGSRNSNSPSEVLTGELAYDCSRDNYAGTFPAPTLSSDGLLTGWLTLPAFHAQNVSDYTYCQERGLIYYENGPYYANEANGYSDYSLLIPQPNPATFVVATDGMYTYAKDSSNVYFGGQVFKEADSKTFQIIKTFTSADGPTSFFEKDVNHVYNEGVIFPQADPATFSIIPDSAGNNSGYEKDAKYVFAGTDGIVTGADPATITILSDYFSRSDGTSYIKDALHVYAVIEAADGGLDESGRPFSTHVIPGADPNSFVVVTNDPSIDARDKNHTYEAGQVVN